MEGDKNRDRNRGDQDPRESQQQGWSGDETLSQGDGEVGQPETVPEQRRKLAGSVPRVNSTRKRAPITRTTCGIVRYWA